MNPQEQIRGIAAAVGVVASFADGLITRNATVEEARAAILEEAVRTSPTIINRAPAAVTRRTGRQVVELRYDELRLPAATYEFSLFLVVVTPDGRRRATDVRSWTYGNGLSLQVEGTSSPGAVRLPLSLEVHP